MRLPLKSSVTAENVERIKYQPNVQNSIHFWWQSDLKVKEKKVVINDHEGDYNINNRRNKGREISL